MGKVTREYQQYLRTIGWPIKADGKKGPKTRAAIREFQNGWAKTNLRLRVNGRLNRRTKKWIKWSARNGGRCSDNFRYKEFKSNGNGWIKVKRVLVIGLEKYRKKAGATGIVSGHRDEEYNDEIGGAEKSQHVPGNAADLYPKLTVNQVKDLNAFSGIGYQGSGPLKGKVRHVDVRHTGPINLTGGTIKNPTIWLY